MRWWWHGIYTILLEFSCFSIYISYMNNIFLHVNFFTSLFEIAFTWTKFINFFIYDLLIRFYIRTTFIIRFNAFFIKILKFISTRFSIIAWFHVFLFKNKIDNQAKWINDRWKRNIFSFILFRRYIYKLFPISYFIHELSRNQK